MWVNVGGCTQTQHVGREISGETQGVQILFATTGIIRVKVLVTQKHLMVPSREEREGRRSCCWPRENDLTERKSAQGRKTKGSVILRAEASRASKDTIDFWTIPHSSSFTFCFSFTFF